jgi:hypothetical protein
MIPLNGRQTIKKLALLAECQKVLDQSYPKLHIVETNPYIVVRGVFPVHLEQQEIDDFLIEIIFPPTYSDGIPLVKELGDRVPRDLEHHVYSNGYLCLFAIDQRQTYWNPEKGVAGFFSEALNDFFLSQLYFEKYGTYPFGERAHGLVGIIEYYAEEFETKDLTIIMRGIEYLSLKEVKGHWKCYCGSGLKMRSCHGKKLRELRGRIFYQDAKKTLEAVRKR